MDHNLSSASLDLMHDIILPPAISFWPLAPGWYALALILVSFIFYISQVRKEKYRRNFYRREALQRLKNLKDIPSVLSLLKGVALHHYSRESIASLSHNAWWDFIEIHSKVKADENIRTLSQEFLYNPKKKTSTKDVELMKHITKIWIQTHKGQA